MNASRARSRFRAATVPAVALSTFLALSGCSSEGESERVTVEVPTTVTVTADPTDLPSSYDLYVALGDSYAAMGSASGPFEGPEFCARSEDNYPHQLAEIYPGINEKRGFIDASCQGATTEHLFNERRINENLDPEEALDQEELNATTSEAAASTSSTPTGTDRPGVLSPQIDALEPDTDLITLSIGGNDIHFGPWSRCVTGMLEGKGEADCDDGLYEDTARALLDLPGRLDDIYRRIHEKAPEATIITTGYMPIASLQDECESTADLPSGTLNWAAGLTVTMNAMVRDAAARNGALYVMPPNADFHSVCAPTNERWTDPTGKETDSFPAHPTHAGQRAMAEAVAEVLSKL
ncbi:SGNH/GDSL hydrolase family protein [Corynebacterium urinipleomorphum]|uniref:SGNH/GDSL hydrolase family protein n=1 Tax=Corynebacterium urinipleomorphum TaxID=1852380 RepID=UPI00139019B4|nr:SGNH/GDSL hydrolase family protein [Corynebacterium urinipleomorphum]